MNSDMNKCDDVPSVRPQQPSFMDASNPSNLQVPVNLAVHHLQNTPLEQFVFQVSHKKLVNFVSKYKTEQNRNDEKKKPCLITTCSERTI